MRIRDILQFGQNMVAHSKFTLDLGIFKTTIDGSQIWEIHTQTILTQRIVSDCFCSRRLFWESFLHEFQFVEQDKHRKIIVDSLEETEATLTAIGHEIRGTSSADAWLLENLQFLLGNVGLTRRRIIETPTWQAYNAWNDSIDPGGDDERMTPADETESLIGIIRTQRKDTYPVWSSLIDLLRDGPIKIDAKNKLSKGRASVGLLESDSDQNWNLDK